MQTAVQEALGTRVSAAFSHVAEGLLPPTPPSSHSSLDRDPQLPNYDGNSDATEFSGAITQCSSKGHSCSLVCPPWSMSLFARVCYSGLIIRLSRDTQVVFVRAASVG